MLSYRRETARRFVPWKMVPFEKLRYSFLFAFHSNCGRTFSRFDTIHERDRHPHPARQTPPDGIDRAYA